MDVQPAPREDIWSVAFPDITIVFSVMLIAIAP
jgi:hypothetical protein